MTLKKKKSHRITLSTSGIVAWKQCTFSEAEVNNKAFNYRIEEKKKKID